MKIGDQNPVSPAPPSVESTPETVASSTAAGFAEELEAPDGAGEADGVSGLGDLEALAARVEQGELAPAEAVQLLVERVLDAQLGANSPSALREQARTLVQEALATDPHLVALTRRLGRET